MCYVNILFRDVVQCCLIMTLITILGNWITEAKGSMIVTWFIIEVKCFFSCDICSYLTLIQVYNFYSRVEKSRWIQWTWGLVCLTQSHYFLLKCFLAAIYCIQLSLTCPCIHIILQQQQEVAMNNLTKFSQLDVMSPPGINFQQCSSFLHVTNCIHIFSIFLSVFYLTSSDDNIIELALYDGVKWKILPEWTAGLPIPSHYTRKQDCLSTQRGNPFHCSIRMNQEPQNSFKLADPLKCNHL